MYIYIMDLYTGACCGAAIGVDCLTKGMRPGSRQTHCKAGRIANDEDSNGQQHEGHCRGLGSRGLTSKDNEG